MQRKASSATLLQAVAAVLMLAGLPALDASAEEQSELACRERPVEPEGRPRVGLVLGGGGARGIAHIAVLRTIEELQIPVDCVAGTSMGALIGALYASGMSVDEMEALVQSLDWASLFKDELARPERSYRRKLDDGLVISQPGLGIGSRGLKIAPGVMSGERVTLTFSKFIEPVSVIEHFDHLPIPYRAVAADLNTGAAVVIEGGDLALAMRASMSVPGVWPPVILEDRVLVDGGVANNLPVDVVRTMGADIVIAVDVGTPLMQLESNADVLSVVSQLSGFLTTGNTATSIASLTENDVLISPTLGDRVGSADFDKGALALVAGAEGVAAVRPQLERLGISASAHAQNRSLRVGREIGAPVIHFVRLRNQTAYSDEFLQQYIDVPLGQPLDSAALERQLYVLYGFNTLTGATYEVAEDNGQTGVVIHLRGKPQGPNYLEAGLSMSSDFEGRYDFSVRLGVLRSPINETGGEARTLIELGDQVQLLGEYYQPFGHLNRYFYGARLHYLSRKLDQFDADGNRLSEYEASQVGVQLAAGREFGNYGALGFGLRRFTGSAERLIGDPALLPDFDFEIGEAFVELTLDRLDSPFFPRSGYLARNRYLFSRESLGADVDFEQWEVDFLGAYSRGKHAIQGGMRYHVTVNGTAPIQSAFRIGGFSRLVGYQNNELVGQNYAVLLGGYSYHFGDVLGQPALLGGTLEYGNVWQDRSDMSFSDGVMNGSAYVGIDSWIGPILLGIGGREGGERNAFLEVGRRF